MKAKNVYKAEVWGLRLDDYGRTTSGVKMISAQFTNKDYMLNWARNQINALDIEPVRAYFYINKDGDWELIAKAYAKVHKVKTKRRTLSWV